MKGVTSYGLSHKGRVRERNEDSFAAYSDLGLFLVSDGVGGHLAGDVASKLVVESLPGLLAPVIGETKELDAEDLDKVAHAVDELNMLVYNTSISKPALSGMRATLVLLLVRYCRALLCHLGDSRAYLLRDGTLKQLTRDHSVIQALLEAGEINTADIATHPAKGKVTRCIGMGGDIVPDTRSINLKSGDRILLCSDGLTAMVASQRIEHCLHEFHESRQAAEALVDMANKAGGEDNITVLIVDYRESRAGVNTSLEALERTSVCDHIPLENAPVAFIVDMDHQPPRFCFALSAPAVSHHTALHHVVEQDGEEDRCASCFTIGREPEDNLCLSEDYKVSRRHCIIRVLPSEKLRLVIEDLQSKNGTYLNGKRLYGKADLPLPSWLLVGGTNLSIVPVEPDTGKEALMNDLNSGVS